MPCRSKEKQSTASVQGRDAVSCPSTITIFYCQHPVNMSRPRRPTMPSLPSDGSYQSSIRLRRMPSNLNLTTVHLDDIPSSGTSNPQTRRRSSSAPLRPPLSSLTRTDDGRLPTQMSPIVEGETTNTLRPPPDTHMRDSIVTRDYALTPAANKPLPKVPSAASLRRKRATSNASSTRREYDSDLVDLLDIVGRSPIAEHVQFKG